MWIIQFRKKGSDEWLNLATNIYRSLVSAKVYLDSARDNRGLEFDYRLVECKVLDD